MESIMNSLKTLKTRWIAAGCAVMLAATGTTFAQHPLAVTQGVLDEITPFAIPSPYRSYRLFSTATNALSRATVSNLWIDGSHPVFPDGKKVFGDTAKAVSAFTALGKMKPYPVGFPGMVLDWSSRLANADRLLASTALDEALAAGVPDEKLKGAIKALEKGDTAFQDHKFTSAIAAYQAAWQKAMKAKSKL